MRCLTSRLSYGYCLVNLRDAREASRDFWARHVLRHRAVALPAPSFNLAFSFIHKEKGVAFPLRYSRVFVWATGFLHVTSLLCYAAIP